MLKTIRVWKEKMGIGRLLLLALCLLSGLIVIVSLIKPKMAYKSYAYHVLIEEGEEEVPLSLSPGNVVTFNLETGAEGLNGIQPCFYWGGDTYPHGHIILDAYNADTYPAADSYLGQARTMLDPNLSTAFSYGEFSYDTSLTGNLRFEIRYEDTQGEGIYPFLITAGGDPLLYYARVVKTYPLVFDGVVVFLIAFLILCLQKKNREGEERSLQKGIGIELPYFLTCLLLGGILIFLTGTNQISYDEQTHFTKTYNLSFVGEVYDTPAALTAKTLQIPSFHGFEERKLVASTLDAQDDYTKASIFGQSKMITYEKRAYLFSAVFMMLGRSLGLPFHLQLMVAKWGNLILYSLITTLAVRKARKNKAIVMAAGLIPTAIFTASQFSYDPCVNAFLLLYGVLLMNLYLGEDKKEKLSSLDMGLMLLSLVVGCYSKLIYVLLAFPLLFLHKDRFHSGRRKWLFRAGVTILMLFLILEIIAPSYGGSSAVTRIANAGDDRIEGTSVLGQLSFILHNLPSYLGLLFSSIGGRVAGWLSGSYAFLNYGYMGSAPLLLTYLWMLFFLGISLFSPKAEARRALPKKTIVLHAVTVFVMICAIWTVLYMSFNPVGADYIGGVQDRYFIPLILPIALLMQNGSWTLKLSEKTYNRIALIVAACLTLICIILLAYLPFYV